MRDSDSRKDRIIAFYDQEAPDYIEQYEKPTEELERYPANAIRLEIIVDRLKARGSHKVLDIGAGSGGPLIRFLREGFDATGIDFSERMVEFARVNLDRAGLDRERVRLGDLESDETLPKERFDAIVATGVFPHNLDDAAAYRNIERHLIHDGFALIEYRNALMSLYSLNRYSEAFFWHDLMKADGLPSDLREAIREFLAVKFDTSIRQIGRPREIEYADILARFHNPLTLGDDIAGYGLRVEVIHYYHFHAGPPSMEARFRRAFWEVSLQMENPQDWRGMFMASAYVAEIVPQP